MMAVVMNNLPELIGGLCAMGVSFWLGRRSTRWPLIGYKN